MHIVRNLVVVGVVAVVAFAAGSWRSGTPSGASQVQKALYYSCPMHPQYHADRAGDCPSCGMRLEPVYAAGSAAPASAGASLPPGTFQVSPDQQQLVGVQVGVAATASGSRTLRTSGRVAPNENAVYPLVSGAEARVLAVGLPAVGSWVKRNEVLASLYATEVQTLAQNYFIALAGVERVAPSGDPNQIAATKTALARSEESLRNLGVSDGQLQEFRTTRQVSPTIKLASPVDGIVLQRNVLTGQRVERGTELYRVADIRRVWIFADVYANQLPFVRAGMRATVAAAQHGRVYAASVSTAQPVFDEAGRTMKVRLEADNPGFALKPGMFVDVAFEIQLPAALAVPSDAIVDTGHRKTVFVDRGNGRFEPRQVETGWRIGDQVEITKGLAAGERIVLSGTFLLDSESRLKAVAPTGGVAPTSAPQTSRAALKDPVCGMDVDQKHATAAGLRATHNGGTFFFCSDVCKKRFEKEPETFAKQ
ncbi:MAG: efflux RND transporter periplasmic adaptor subunit [Acidobacteriota bacterium]